MKGLPLLPQEFNYTDPNTANTEESETIILTEVSDSSEIIKRTGEQNRQPTSHSIR